MELARPILYYKCHEYTNRLLDLEKEALEVLEFNLVTLRANGTFHYLIMFPFIDDSALNVSGEFFSEVLQKRIMQWLEAKGVKITAIIEDDAKKINIQLSSLNEKEAMLNRLPKHLKTEKFYEFFFVREEDVFSEGKKEGAKTPKEEGRESSDARTT